MRRVCPPLSPSLDVKNFFSKVKWNVATVYFWSKYRTSSCDCHCTDSLWHLSSNQFLWYLLRSPKLSIFDWSPIKSESYFSFKSMADHHWLLLGHPLVIADFNILYFRNDYVVISRWSVNHIINGWILEILIGYFYWSSGTCLWLSDVYMLKGSSSTDV